MSWRFKGYASVFNTPCRDGDVFLSGCFSEFLEEPGHLSIPMLNAHDPDSVIGRWLFMQEDSYGLFVVGELLDKSAFLSAPYPGLSITPINSKGPAEPTRWGGHFCRTTRLSEISIVNEPLNPLAVIIGPIP